MQHNLKILNSAKYRKIISPLLRESVKYTFMDVVSLVGITFSPFWTKVSFRRKMSYGL